MPALYPFLKYYKIFIKINDFAWLFMYLVLRENMFYFGDLRFLIFPVSKIMFIATVGFKYSTVTPNVIFLPSTA